MVQAPALHQLPACRVSVVIANFNYARYLPACIESLIAQTLRPPEVEIILIDDASTDGSWDVIRQFAHHAGVRAIRHEANRGHIASWSEGVALARGRYLTIVDADDVVRDPRALEQQARVLDSEASVGLVFSDIDVIDTDGHTLQRRHVTVPRRIPSAQAFRRLMMRNFIAHTGAMYRETCVRTVGTYDPRFPYSSDWHLFLRIASRWDLAHIDAPLYGYRFHGRQMHDRIDRRTAIDAVRSVLDDVARYAPITDFAAIRRTALAGFNTVVALDYARLGLRHNAAAHLVRAARLDARALLSTEAAKAIVLMAVGIVLGQRLAGALRRFRNLYRL